MKLYSSIHLLLLAYIIAALTFWWISLERQSRIIYDKEVSALNTKISSPTTSQYALAYKDIELRKSRRSKQYLGEGLTFLIVILVGSSIVFTTYRFSNKLSRQQNNFMMSVTHELKSPIAAMKLTLQTLQRHQLDEEKQKQLLSRCITESDRLNDLCNNILIASQMEGGQYKRAWEDCSISNLLVQIADSYSARYPSRFEINIMPDVVAFTDKMLLQLAINNIIENAVKYTPDNKLISIVLKGDVENASIIIKDAGIGISDIEKKRVFEKFYRVGNEETRKAKGTGLGLYLTKKIIKNLKGHIALKDNIPNGAIFEISIPVR
jgi:signal transduction histidine kinase